MPTEAEKEAVDEEDGDEKGLGRSGTVILAVAAAVFALVAMVLVIVIVRDSSTKSSDADRTEISTTAARVAEAISSLDANDDGTFLRVLEQLGTSPVVSQYQQFIGPFRALMEQAKVQSIRGRSQEVWVGDISESQASAIVRLDVITVGANTRVNPGQYVEVSLAKLEGVWKVDNVQILNVTLASGPLAVPTTTTTTAPSSG